MRFDEALRNLRAGARLKRTGWDGVWLQMTANKQIITLFLDRGASSVTWTPSLGEIMSEDWEISEEKPAPQMVKVPPNDFFKPMGAR